MMEQTFTCGPNSHIERSAFVGEDIRSAKVLRHIDLPIPAVIYELKDGRFAKSISRFGGMATTIIIYESRKVLETAESKNCIHDPETGRLWK